MNNLNLLRLLQITNTALPVGAYSYSEGLESLVETHVIHDQTTLKHWLEQELGYGAIRVEAAIMLRGYRATEVGDLGALEYWNNWAKAARETAELREQSWQMGHALRRLGEKLEPKLSEEFNSLSQFCSFAIGFGIIAAHWEIEPSAAILGYLHSWATNLISASVRLIPLGQTIGQQLLSALQSAIVKTSSEILTLSDDDLSSCGWGLALASMAHETQYSRLFRS
ncbi:urease accessory protein UreF [Aerosakkonemataceae cyanobacterium BLCC-F154]|uniref:Urease accessory protein UreF n=1 Tax=Floridaenema fluviatile BLCC-F154 TaxID=3153640 RepID=A0ABV4YB16_9CYAN